MPLRPGGRRRDEQWQRRLGMGELRVIYFLRSETDGYVKIGWTGDLNARRKDLQAASGHRLTLLRAFDAPRWAEVWLHERFSADRQTGEWFTYSSEMMTVQPPSEFPPSLVKSSLASNARMLEKTEFGVLVEAAREIIRLELADLRELADRTRGIPRSRPVVHASGPPLPPRTVSPQAASQITGLGLTKVTALIGDGTLRTAKVGRRRLVFLDSIEELLSDHAQTVADVGEEHDVIPLRRVTPAGRSNST